MNAIAMTEAGKRLDQILALQRAAFLRGSPPSLAIERRCDLLESGQLYQPIHNRLLGHHIGPRDCKSRRLRGEVQPVLIALLLT